MKKFSILTSSRADFGIYLPLIKALNENKDIAVEILAFGSHLESDSGFTLNEVKQYCPDVISVPTNYTSDSPEGTALHLGATVSAFAEIWADRVDTIDALICLGDRYEVLGAVLSSVPFEIPVIHLFGGETTGGSIDDSFRHAISHCSIIHFVSHVSHAERLSNMLGHDEMIYNVGSISLEGIESFEPLSVAQFAERFDVSLEKKTILVTFHPETRGKANHKEQTDVLVKSMLAMNQFQFLVTLPNMDPGNKDMREAFISASNLSGNIKVVESLGKQGYFSAMHHCHMVLGNSSSALVESASFGIYAINLGNRQKGRTSNSNVKHCTIEQDAIINTINTLSEYPVFEGENEFHNKDGAVSKIIATLLS